jgi:hypothetical protein
VYQPPVYTPDLNLLEGIWSVFKRVVPANPVVASFGHLVQVIRHGPKKIQSQPDLIEGASPEPAGPGRTDSMGHHELEIF